MGDAAAGDVDPDGETAVDEALEEEQEPSTPTGPAAAIQSRLQSNMTHFGCGCVL